MRSDPRVELVLGGPGAGKTTHLLDIVQHEIANGVSPRDIAFVSFTRAAADEAAERAGSKFGFSPEDLPWFRTIHSLAYQRLQLTREDVMDARDYRAFGNLVGERLSGSYDTEVAIPSGSNGDMMLRISDYANTCNLSLQDAWHSLAEPVDWWALKRFDAAYRAYKADMGKVDFTDMLLSYINEGEPTNVKVAVIDEAQDLTPMQWSVVERAFGRAERIYICGDDDQAIYRWAGSDVNYFLGISDNPTVLPVSHRLPRAVYNVAQSVAKRISRRYAKDYRPTDKAGTVAYHLNPDSVDLSEGSWLLLARNKYKLQYLEQMVREAGYNYRTRNSTAIDPDDVATMKLWEDIRKGRITKISSGEVRTLHKAIGLPVPAIKELNDYDPKQFFSGPLNWPWYDALAGIPRARLDYYMSVVRRGEKLTEEPRIRIETIHGVKGAEADNVLLMTDMTARTSQGYDLDPDSEHRVFYVGVTRARQSLHIVVPQGDTGYPL